LRKRKGTRDPKEVKEKKRKEEEEEEFETWYNAITKMKDTDVSKEICKNPFYRNFDATETSMLA
jgi:hypothetical protein